MFEGFTYLAENARVMVLAATNRPWELDEAILRRLPRAFEVGMPDEKQRASILRVILKDENVEPSLDFDRLARLCEGYSGSDLTELCKQAAFLPIRDLLSQEKSGNITSQVFLSSLTLLMVLCFFCCMLCIYVLTYALNFRLIHELPFSCHICLTLCVFFMRSLSISFIDDGFKRQRCKMHERCISFSCNS